MKKLLLPLLFALLAFGFWQKETGAATSYQILTPDSVTESVWMKEMGVKQERIRLKNGMGVWLIEAPATARSMMAVAVNSGTFDDPTETMGCAHLVEHMLFMGSKEYPEEESFSTFVKNASGSTNAQTNPNSTLYGFTCSNEQIEEGFKRLTDMVQHPLLRQECIDREKQAVNEEFQQKIPLQGYKNWLTLCHLVDRSHPLHRLGCGNAKTLENVSAQDLQHWHRTHYAPSATTLILYTSKDLAQQRLWVQEAWMGWENALESSDKQIPAVVWSFDTRHLIKQIATDGKTTLDLAWFIPLTSKQDALSLSHISSWLGHEFPDGLCAELKKQELALSIASGAQTMGNIGTLFLSIDLTSKGKDQIELCLKLCQEYLDFLAKEPVSERWLVDQQNIVKNTWATTSFQASLDLAFTLTGSVIEENLETFPFQSSWPTEASIARAQAITKNLLVDEAPKMLSLAADVPFSKGNLISSGVEPWTGNSYEIRTLENLANIQTPSISWSRAADNPFLPQTLPDFMHFAPSEAASVFHRSFGDFIYYQNAFEGGLNDSLFWGIETAQTQPEIDAVAFWQIFTRLANETTQTLHEHAQEAGQSFALAFQNKGIALTFNGYSSSVQQQLVEDLFSALTSLEISSELFQQQKQLLLDDLGASLKQGPLPQFSSLLRKNFIEDGHSTQEIISHIQALSFEDFQKMYSLFKNAPLRFTIAAVSSKEADLWLECFDKIHHSCNSPQITDFATFPSYPFKTKWAPSQQESVYFHDLKEGNLVLFTWPLGSSLSSEKDNFLNLKIFEPLLDLSAFDNLRTKQQLGYVVKARISSIGDQKTLMLFVLSSNKSAEEVTLAMREQINIWKKQIEEFSEADFNASCKQQLSQLNEPIESSQELLNLNLNLWLYEEDPYQVLAKQKCILEKASFKEATQAVLTLLSQEPYVLKCLPEPQLAK